MYILPNPNAPSYRVSTTIEGGEYTLEYTYDEHRNLWRLGVMLDDDVVLGHQPLYALNPLYVIPFASELTGAFVCIPITGESYSYEALLELDYAVVYAEGEELDALLALSDDVFESVSDTFITPIVVTYPQQGAVLSNATVTLTGTGPANQTITARGEDIAVDFSGSWSWTHTFTQSSNTVTFEGSDGQRTSVSFSIVMQPLMIDDPSDAAGYVYLTEQPITGQGTPNSVIEVNGQSVQVAQDGSWSTVVHLNAGVNMVVASSQDGQSAMLVLDLFDPVTLSPEIWLDPTDQSTLFRDAEGTQPVEAVGDPVGLWRNKGSLGADGDAAQPVSANRPVWTNTGGGGIIMGGPMNISALSTLPAPRAFAVGVGSPMGTLIEYAGWRRNTGTNLGGHIRRNSAGRIEGIAGLPQKTMKTDIQSHAALFSESASGRVYALSSSGTRASDDVGPRGTMNTPFFIGSANSTVGHVFIFDRELTDEESTKLLTWMEAQHD